MGTAASFHLSTGLLMKIKALAIASALFGFATLANAVTVTVNSTQYDVSTAFGNFTPIPGEIVEPWWTNSTELMAQPWWGNQSLAHEFAAAVGGNLGYPNTPVIGPFFAYSFTDSWIVVMEYSGSSVIYSQTLPDTFFGTFARATLVPDSGMSAVLLAFGLAAIGLFARRRKI